MDLQHQPTASLHHLGYRTVLPHPRLRPWVQRYWLAKQRLLPTQGYCEHLYPDGGSSLIFRFDKDQLPDASFSSKQSASRVNFTDAIDMLGIRFHPGGAYALFNLDMPNLSTLDAISQDLHLALNQPFFDQLREQLASCLPEQRLHLIDHWLLTLIESKTLQTTLISQIRQSLSVALPIENIARDCGLSRRQLERRFKQETGITMIKLKGLYQAKYARQLISQSPHLPLVEVGLQAGYYDQAHFTHHFHKLSLQTPRQYQLRKQSSVAKLQ